MSSWGLIPLWTIILREPSLPFLQPALVNASLFHLSHSSHFSSNCQAYSYLYFSASWCICPFRIRLCQVDTIIPFTFRFGQDFNSGAQFVHTLPHRLDDIKSSRQLHVDCPSWSGDRQPKEGAMPNSKKEIDMDELNAITDRVLNYTPPTKKVKNKKRSECESK